MVVVGESTRRLAGSEVRIVRLEALLFICLSVYPGPVVRRTGYTERRQLVATVLCPQTCRESLNDDMILLKIINEKTGMKL